MLAKQIFLMLMMLFCSSSLSAKFGLSFSSGEGVMDISPYRVGVSWNFGNIWRKDYDWGLHAIWESSAGYWAGRNDYSMDTPRELQVMTSGPLFRWQRQTPLFPVQIAPYVELGVGASWLSEKEIGGRKLSLHFQFEDKFGVGLLFGKQQQYDISLRAVHYSNASIKRPNSGVNLWMLNVGMWFQK